MIFVSIRRLVVVLFRAAYVLVKPKEETLHVGICTGKPVGFLETG